MDALTHNIESYLSPAYHPLCDGIALEGVRIAARALATAVREPGNLQARADMMMSSMMGAIAFQKDLGARALLRARAGRGGRPAPRPGQRADDRHRDGLELRGRAGASSTSWRMRAGVAGGGAGLRAPGCRQLKQQRRHHRRRWRSTA